MFSYSSLLIQSEKEDRVSHKIKNLQSWEKIVHKIGLCKNENTNATHKTTNKCGEGIKALS
jgi:hypothetical protein